MNDGYLNKDFFRKMACHLLLEPVRIHLSNPCDCNKVDLYMNTAKWNAIVEIAKKEKIQSYFEDWSFWYVDNELEYKEWHLEECEGLSAEELKVAMIGKYLEFESSEEDFNGYEWDYSPYWNLG